MTSRQPDNPSPLNKTEVLDRYFLEHRAKLLDIAAFLDRVDRAQPETQAGSSGLEDFRLGAFRAAVEILSDPNPHRAKRILERLSDPTRTPVEATEYKGAVGAYRPADTPITSDTTHNGDTP